VSRQREAAPRKHAVIISRTRSTVGNSWQSDSFFVFIGFSAGPGVHIVDVLGLRDPLLAQLAENDVIDVRRIHDLRHTFASLLLQQGESIVYAKEQLGHASIQITVDTYGHLIPGANRADRRQAR